MNESSVGLELSWPTALAAPLVEGNRVTYPEVYPGVDVEFAAVGTSFTQHVIVKTPVAVKDARVRTLALKQKVVNGVMRQAGAGYLVTDREGREVLRGAQPVMWDSKARKLPSGPVVDDDVRSLDEGDQQSAMGLSVASGVLTVRPNLTLLDDPKLVLPAVLDPTTSPAIYNWAMVDHARPDTEYYNWVDDDQGVGYNTFEGYHKKRIFYSFPTSAYNGKSILGASLYAFETYSARCAVGAVNAYLVNDFGTTINWNNQPAAVSTLPGPLGAGWSVKAGRSDCYPGGKMASWDVKAGVANRVAAKAARSTFKLQGSTESTDYSWMRFAGPKHPSTSYRPKLSVTYNTPPIAPTASMMWAPTSTQACATTSPGPSLNPLVGVSESLYAKTTDPDGSAVSSQIQIRNSADVVVHNTNFTSRASGSVVSVVVPSSLGNGVYRFRSAAYDGTVSGGFGANCYFTVDRDKPATPVVTSTVWRDGVLAPQDATTGLIRMGSAGATSFTYGWEALSTSGGAVGGNLSITATASKSMQTWKAAAKDAAGNVNDTVAQFRVKRTQPGKLAAYSFNGALNEDGTSLPCSVGGMPVCDTATTQLDGTAALADAQAAAAYRFDLPADGAGFAPQEGRWNADATICEGVPGAAPFDPSNHAMLLADGGAVVEMEQRPLVSERSFTIGGWVLMTDATQSRTLLSQQRDPAGGAGGAALAYDLGYDQVADRFLGRVMDASGAVIGQAEDALPRVIEGTETPASHEGAWVYVAMVFDSTAKTVRVDAMHSAQANPPCADIYDYTPGVAAPVTGTAAAGVGSFVIGSGSTVQGERAGWSGAVDNLALWQGVPASTTLQLNAKDKR